VHHSGSVCPGCGGTRFAKLGEDVTEVVEKIAARLKVIHHVRPKLSCRCCERIVQAPAPDLPIEKGRPGPGLVANVVVSKYLDGLPLYRQFAPFAYRRSVITRRRRACCVLTESVGATYDNKGCDWSDLRLAFAYVVSRIVVAQQQ
jgi:transposase